jgi:hypothetical protein
MGGMGDVGGGGGVLVTRALAAPGAGTRGNLVLRNIVFRFSRT